MVIDFYKDLAQAREAEYLVLQELASRTKDYTFFAIGDIPEYYHKGDIKAVGADGREIFIEVKNDSCIAKTDNVLCEEEVYYKKNYELKRGNMYSDYEIYAVVSQGERKIYLIDFETLRKNYKKGEYKVVKHYDQDTYCYLCGLWQIKRWGALLATLSY